MIEFTEAQQELESERRKRIFREYLTSTEYQDKIKLRLKINDACSRSAEARAATFNLCARPDNPAEGCIFFIENFGYTFDPRPQAYPHHIPFVLFEFQKDAIRWFFEHIDGGKDGLIEKSRDMGLSWLICYVPLWLWLFRDGTNTLFGSYKEDLVDDRTNDSLMGKVSYAVDSLPKWILPKGFDKGKHRTHMRLRNPATGNLISGDTMNPDFARGSRKTVILFDELASWDYAKDAWESAGDSTNCRIGNSTPKGYDFFAMLRRDSGIDVLTLHWRLHPMKDETWYEYEKQRRTPEEVAQELDISYNKSQEGRIYTDWNEEFVTFGYFPYDDNLPLYVGWDFGGTDDTAIIWLQKYGSKYRIIDTYRNSGKLIEFYVPFITGVVPSEGYQYNKKDLDCIKSHVGWKRGTHFGDPAGRFRNQVTDKTVISVLQEHGITVNFQEIWQEFERRKNCTRGLIRSGIQINDNERTKYFDMCIATASYPKVRNQGVQEVRSMKPKHDSTSHYRSALEYLSLGIENFVDRPKRPYDKFKPKEVIGRRRSIGY